MTGAESWLTMLPSRSVTRRRLAAGEAVFRQGDAASAMHLVESGRVRLVRHLGDGSAVVLHVARKGDSFAEAALFADAYHCDAVAETGSRIVSLPKTLLLESLAMRPDAALDLARLLASQVRELRTRLELRNVRSAPGRVLAWLRLQASGNPPQVRPDRPWAGIASEIGLTQEAVYRALASLERCGRIRRNRGEVVLLPEEELGRE
jgi:CRP-like cAMP-binding protein